MHVQPLYDLRCTWLMLPKILKWVISSSLDRKWCSFTKGHTITGLRVANNFWSFICELEKNYHSPVTPVWKSLWELWNMNTSIDNSYWHWLSKGYCRYPKHLQPSEESQPFSKFGHASYSTRSWFSWKILFLPTNRKMMCTGSDCGMTYVGRTRWILQIHKNTCNLHQYWLIGFG